MEAICNRCDWEMCSCGPLVFFSEWGYVCQHCAEKSWNEVELKRPFRRGEGCRRKIVDEIERVNKKSRKTDTAKGRNS